MNQTIFHGRQTPASIKSIMPNMDPTVIKSLILLKLNQKMMTMILKQPKKLKLNPSFKKKKKSQRKRRDHQDQRHLDQALTLLKH